MCLYVINFCLLSCLYSLSFVLLLIVPLCSSFLSIFLSSPSTNQSRWQPPWLWFCQRSLPLKGTSFSPSPCSRLNIVESLPWSIEHPEKTAQDWQCINKNELNNNKGNIYMPFKVIKIHCCITWTNKLHLK